MKTTHAIFTRTLAVCACILSLSACSDMNKTQQRTLSGAGIGAGVGAAGTLMTGGCVACGAAVGGAVGAGAGYVYDQSEKNKK
jgi:osmotically inducible lipoprotein OsmB